MDEAGKSHNRVVPKKVSNKARRRAAEGLEGRRLAEWNSPQATTLQTQGREGVQTALGRVRQAAERQKGGARFTALLHHIYAIDALRAAFYELERDAAPGVDGETWEHYGQELEAHLAEVSDRVRRGAYRPQPVRRAYVPKRDGQQRPIGVIGARGQDRPTCDGRGAQRRVRARVCRLLVRREARAQRTSSAGGAGSWSDEQADRVGARRRSPQLLRIAGPGEAGGIRRTADWGRARGAADQALVGRGRAGRWEVDAQWDRGP